MRFLYKNFHNLVKNNIKSYKIAPFKFDLLNLEEKILGNY